jgi:outer membrane protein OmpA-like peptidoglycan-associated protein
MRLTSLSAIATCISLALPGVSLAQGVVTGQEIQVNPVSPAGKVLFYPGGEYARTVPSLLYPGEKNAAIQLHMPTGRHRQAVAETQKVPKKEAQAEPKPKPKPKPKRVASAAPAPVPPPTQAAPQGYTNPFGGPDLSHVFSQGSAHGNGTPAPTPPPPVARTAPAGPTTGNENLTKRSVILFAKDAPDPAQGALGAIKFLASDLNAAMSTPSARVELQAFGGAKGDKGSDARRLSLKRALSIRQVLIDDGVSPDRIDVRAMGGADDTGPTDRVDVYVKA